jgi:hypothetical protein
VVREYKMMTMTMTTLFLFSFSSFSSSSCYAHNDILFDPPMIIKGERERSGQKGRTHISDMVDLFINHLFMRCELRGLTICLIQETY